MKLLVYRWGSVSEPLFCQALQTLGIEYKEYAKAITNYHSDAVFAQEMITMIHGEGIDIVFSYDYFPMIAMICEINKIPYVSWIYDCPQYTLQSKTPISPYNYIFCFDRSFTRRLLAMGAINCFHYPLAGDVGMLERAMHKAAGDSGKKGSTNQAGVEQNDRENVWRREYACDISFIGNLYNDEKNRLRSVLPTHTDMTARIQREQLSPFAAGCVEGLVQAQQLIYGYNFLKESLQEQPEVIEELVEKCQLSLGSEFIRDDLQMAADVLGMEVSAREREEVLRVISEHYPVRLYTASKLPNSLHNKQLEKMGYADYEKDLPFIYHYSRINLNITSKTIESGIPQRLFDGLSCGGFCLTNYQTEIAECFEDGVELVMYTSMADMLEKVTYYLEHEEERQQIAENGYRKVVECFGLVERVQSMLEMVVGMWGEPVKLLNHINQLLQNGELQKVQEVLEKNKKIAAQDNDLANLYYLSAVCNKERAEGEVMAYKSTVKETLDAFYELQNRLRRLEWWEDYDREEVYTLMEEYELSVYELQWAVETACVDKEKMWRILGE